MPIQKRPASAFRNYKKSLEFVDKVVEKVKLGGSFGRVGYVQFAGKWKRKNGRIVYYNQIKHSTEITFKDVSATGFCLL